MDNSEVIDRIKELRVKIYEIRDLIDYLEEDFTKKEKTDNF